MYVKLKGHEGWFRVVDIVDTGPGSQNIYILYGAGRVDQEMVECLEFD